VFVAVYTLWPCYMEIAWTISYTYANQT